ncbi:MAG TPA: hypothetical protein VKD71_12380 [Gemmataceae bacterium]|nr:hypothetical protein [Gemmataceae bacterium]
MRRSIWLLLPYAIAVAGYAGWCGRGLWNGWVIWVLALAPLALAVYVVAFEMRIHQNLRTALTVSVIPVLACAWIAFCGLGLAWIIADSTKFFTNPALRAGLGAGVTAIVVGFAVFANSKRRSKSEANKSEPNPTEQLQ